MPRSYALLAAATAIVTTTLLAPTAKADDVPSAIQSAVKKAEEKQLPKTRAAYKKIAAIDPTIEVAWSTFSNSTQVEAMVKRLDQDLAAALRKRAKTSAGKASIEQGVKKITVKRSAIPECGVQNGTVALAAEWGAKKGKMPSFGECLAGLEAAAPSPSAVTPTPPARASASTGNVPAGIRSAVESWNRSDLGDFRERFKRSGADAALEVDWSTFGDVDNVAGFSSVLRDLDDVLSTLAKSGGKAPLEQGLKKITARFVKDAEATCTLSGGTLALFGHYGNLYGDLSTPPLYDCVRSLYPAFVRKVPAPGPPKPALKDVVARLESSALPKLKAEFKQKAGIDPAFVIDWSTFYDASEAEAMFKYVNETVVPALQKSVATPRGKALVHTVKTVSIDSTSNAGGNRCRIDGTVLKLRGDWDGHPVEPAECEGSFQHYARPNRGVRDVPRFQED